MINEVDTLDKMEENVAIFVLSDDLIEIIFLTISSGKKEDYSLSMLFLLSCVSKRWNNIVLSSLHIMPKAKDNNKKAKIETVTPSETQG